MTAVLEPQASVVDSFWIGHSVGYELVSADGRLGVVTDVLPCADVPEALAVRAGLLTDRRILIVPVEEIVDVDPLSERVYVASRPQLDGGIPEALWLEETEADRLI